MREITVGTQIVFNDITFIIAGVFCSYGDKSVLLIRNDKNFKDRCYEKNFDIFIREWMLQYIDIDYKFIDAKVSNNDITVWVRKNQLLGLIGKQVDDVLNDFFPLLLSELEDGKIYDAIYKEKRVKVKVNKRKDRGIFLETKQPFGLENYFSMGLITFLRHKN